MRLYNKIRRNLQDYGVRITAGKMIRGLLKPIYFAESYSIYKADTAQHKVFCPFTIRLLDAEDTKLIQQIESENEFLKCKLTAYRICFVVLDNTTLAGFILIDLRKADMPLIRMRSLLKDRQAWIEHVQINKAYRRMGIGSDLLMTALTELHTHNYQELLGGVLPSNTASITLFKSAGFVNRSDIRYRKLLGSEAWS